MTNDEQIIALKDEEIFELKEECTIKDAEIELLKQKIENWVNICSGKSEFMLQQEKEITEKDIQIEQLKDMMNILNSNEK